MQPMWRGTPTWKWEESSSQPQFTHVKGGKEFLTHRLPHRECLSGAHKKRYIPTIANICTGIIPITET